ncbi:SEL1-like repeat protein [Amylibacter sp.]|nr:SEL1-like repeat protein [Amylibacter sp.]
MTAKYNLGVMYIRGLGVLKDCIEAIKWFRLSAEQGYVLA